MNTVPTPCLTYTVYDGDTITESGELEVTWDNVREYRALELERTDVWALQDRIMSQEQKDYREFLRNMPESFATANEAVRAWDQYEVPT